MAHSAPPMIERRLWRLKILESKLRGKYLFMAFSFEVSEFEFICADSLEVTAASLEAPRKKKKYSWDIGAYAQPMANRVSSGS